MGMTLDYFWNLNVKEFEKHVNAFNRKMHDEYIKTDTLNYVLGKYIAYAFNDPKKYPNAPFSEETKKEEIKAMSDSEMERQAKFNTAKMGGEIK